MNIFTHLYVAARLKLTIEASAPVKLGTFRFLYGSIKPDLSSDFVDIPHFKADSTEFVREEIESLLEANLHEYKRCGSSFSERMGILVHYLSDFFCFAHSGEFRGTMLEHHRYELRLMSYFLINLKEVADRCEGWTGYGCPERIVIRHNASSIMRVIEKFHEEYLKREIKEPGLNDVVFTYRACASLCLSVVTACLVSEDEFSEQAGEVFS